MFLDITNIPIKQLQKQISEKYEHRLRNEENFISDNNSHIACFIDGTEQFTGLFFVTDEKFNPYRCFKTNAYIDWCTISDTGKYAAVKTFSNPNHNADSNVLIILDLENSKEIGRPAVETLLDTAGELCIDENKKILCMDFEVTMLQYTFDGKLIDKSQLKRYYELPHISPYAIDERVNNLIDDVDNGECLWIDAKEEIYSLLERLRASLEMSHYQLSLTYKRLGARLAKNGEAAEAMTAYETGLMLNPKLAVKRALEKLRKENPDVSISPLSVPSIEKEKLWEADDYVLPPTIENGKQIQNECRQFDDEHTNSFYEIGKVFIESLETDAYKFLKSVQRLNTMGEEEFRALFNELCTYLNGSARKEARRCSENIIINHNDNSSLSVREEIILNLHSMIYSFTGINLRKVDTKNEK